MKATAHYTRRFLVLTDGRTVEHKKTVRGTRDSNDETTYLCYSEPYEVWPDCPTGLEKVEWVGKSQVVREYRKRVEVK